ncbi:hypothetical protein pb186bvf_009059 [Paramecium bursaria]
MYYIIVTAVIMLIYIILALTLRKFQYKTFNNLKNQMVLECDNQSSDEIANFTLTNELQQSQQSDSNVEKRIAYSQNSIVRYVVIIPLGILLITYDFYWGAFLNYLNRKDDYVGYFSLLIITFGVPLYFVLLNLLMFRLIKLTSSELLQDQNIKYKCIILMTFTHLLAFILIGQMDQQLIDNVSNKLYIITFIPIIIHIAVLFPISLRILNSNQIKNEYIYNAFLKEKQIEKQVKK